MRKATTIFLSLGVALFTVGCASRRTTASNPPRTDQGTMTTTGGAAQTAQHTEQINRLNDATSVFQEIMASPDKSIPQDLLDKAQCVVIVPGLKKGAFVVGGEYGKGYFACRNANGVGWTPPGSVMVTGGSFGFQIGGQETDIVMLVMNPHGEDRLLSSQFTLGADASIAAGPVGRTAAANTDAYMTAEILSWSRSRGAFAGVSLQGATVKEDLGDNQALYGRRLTNRDIIQGQMAPPAAVRPFDEMLDRYSARKTA